MAHNCSSPGDCEETAGYNAAMAITGGVIALVTGIASIITPLTGDEFFDPDDTIVEDDIDTETDDDSIEDDDSDNDEGEEDKDEDDDEDNDDDDFEEEDEDDEDEDSDTTSKTEKTTKKEDSDKTPKSTSETIGEGFDTTTGVLDTSNNIKTLVENLGLQGARIWAGRLKGDALRKAGEKYKGIIDKLKNKGLNGLANKYGARLNRLLQNNALKEVASKTRGIRGFFRKLKAVPLGKLADAFTFVNNFRKKVSSSSSWSEAVGFAAEETFRVGFKTIVTKNPVIAVVDAGLSLAGGPNLDALVDKSIDAYKSAATYVAEQVFDNSQELNARVAEQFEVSKTRISKLNISEAEKRIKLRQALRIIRSKG
jgi:hypothetical protein